MQTCEKGTICGIFLLRVLVYCIVSELALRLQRCTAPSEPRGTQARMAYAPQFSAGVPTAATVRSFGSAALIPNDRRFSNRLGGKLQSESAFLCADQAAETSAWRPCKAVMVHDSSPQESRRTLCRALLKAMPSPLGETVLSCIVVWLIKTARLPVRCKAAVPAPSCPRWFGTSARFHGVVARQQFSGHLNGRDDFGRSRWATWS